MVLPFHFLFVVCGPKWEEKWINYVNVIHSIKPWRTAGKPFGQFVLAFLPSPSLYFSPQKDNAILGLTQSRFMHASI